MECKTVVVSLSKYMVERAYLESYTSCALQSIVDCHVCVYVYLRV